MVVLMTGGWSAPPFTFVRTCTARLPAPSHTLRPPTRWSLLPLDMCKTWPVTSALWPLPTEFGILLTSLIPARHALPGLTDNGKLVVRRGRKATGPLASFGIAAGSPGYRTKPGVHIMSRHVYTLLVLAALLM